MQDILSSQNKQTYSSSKNLDINSQVKDFVKTDDQRHKKEVSVIHDESSESSEVNEDG